MRNCVLLLSGGLDSSTTLAIAKSQDFHVHALSVCYGQRNIVELEASKRVAKLFSIKEHKILNLDLRVFGGSALTSDTQVVSHHEQETHELPSTYVPARNTIMLSLALAYAETINAYDIFFGANIHDYSGYPDCRPEYIKAYESMANLAIQNTREKITIHAPLVNLTKSEIIRRGLALGVDYAQTHSCYDPKEDLACGVCSACFYRKKGFSDANIKDPTRYAPV